MIRIDRMDPRLVLCIGVIYGILLALTYMPRERKVTLVFAGAVIPPEDNETARIVNAEMDRGGSFGGRTVYQYDLRSEYHAKPPCPDCP